MRILRRYRLKRYRHRMVKDWKRDMKARGRRKAIRSQNREAGKSSGPQVRERLKVSGPWSGRTAIRISLIFAVCAEGFWVVRGGKDLAGIFENEIRVSRVFERRRMDENAEEGPGIGEAVSLDGVSILFDEKAVSIFRVRERPESDGM